MIETARYSNYGPMRGLIKFIRPEIVGRQHWRVALKIQEPMPDGEVRIDEVVLNATEACEIGQMHAVALQQISEAVKDCRDAKVDMIFSVRRPGGNKGRRR